MADHPLYDSWRNRSGAYRRTTRCWFENPTAYLRRKSIPRIPSMDEPVSAVLGIAAIRGPIQASGPTDIRSALSNGNRFEATVP